MFITILFFEMMVSTAGTPDHNKTGSKTLQESKAISVVNKSFGEGFRAKKFYSVVVDEDNTKWFLTETGVVSFNGKKWSVHNKNRKVSAENLMGFAFEVSSFGPELWIASPQGVTVASIPIDARTGATTYDTQNTPILSNNVLSVAIGKSPLRWFGTDKGISAFLDSTWLPYTGYSYQREYPESFFREFPINTMATSPDGNFLYVGTDGGGVARIFRNDVDGITGASPHAYWGPIDMPSDKVYSICIAPDGTQWYGTDNGVARHTGARTLDNWTVYDIRNGLIDNFVQSIVLDKNENLWFGTKGGVSVYDGTTWRSYTINDGLNSNNILCIKLDKNGILWFGTDNGVMSFNNGEFTSYK